MSTKAIRAMLREVRRAAERGDSYLSAGIYEVECEVEAIEKAAKDLSRLSVGDFTYSIRDRAAGDASFSGNTWEHPDVKAWSDAATLVDAIAKEAP